MGTLLNRNYCGNLLCMFRRGWEDFLELSVRQARLLEDLVSEASLLKAQPLVVLRRLIQLSEEFIRTMLERSDVTLKGLLPLRQVIG